MFAGKFRFMQFVDTHTHLYQPDFKDDIENVIHGAMQAGVEKFLLPNIDRDSIAPMLNLVSNYPGKCFPMMGLHPTSVKEDYKNELAFIENELINNTDKFIGVGEIGIDLYWDKTFLDNQINAFEYQINLAKKLHLPIVIHARESFDEIFDVLNITNDDKLRGVFHSFSGTSEQAGKAMSYGFYLGVGGIVTFKNGGLDKILNDIPLERIILETDSPYLSPAPKRGKRNESANIRIIAERIAQIKNIPVQHVASVTTSNANKLFNLEKHG